MMFGNIVSNLKDLAQGIVAIPELADTAKEIDVMVKNVNSPLLIMVMGEFSTGKSSFINALVEKEVAIVDAKPTTAVITKLCYGLEDRITVYFLDGSQKDYNTEEFVSLTVEDESTTELRKNIDYVERAMPIEMLKSMTIIDSPGLNSLEKSHEGTTRQFMDRADTVVWLFDAHDSCKQTEIDAMKRLNPRLSPLVLVNKMDLIDEDEGDSPEKILSDVSRKLRNNRLEVQDIIGISAKLAFQEKQNNNEKFLSESNMEEFYQKVETVIIPHRDTYKQNAMFDELAKILFGAGTILSNKKSENDKQKDTDYGTYIETEETLAVVADALENVADAFLEFFDLSRSNFSDDQVNKKKLNASERTVFGTLYWLGLIIEKNAEVAQKHLEAAAVRGDEVAQFVLANLYWALGDYTKAKYWVEATKNDALDSIRKGMYEEEIRVGMKEIFTEKLVSVFQGNAFCNTIKISGEELLAEDDTAIILPICKEALDFFTPDEIVKNLKIEYLDDKIDFIYSIKNQDETSVYSHVHSYLIRDVICLQADVPTIEMFPDVRIMGLNEYYLYYENSYAQNQDNTSLGEGVFFVRPWYQRKDISSEFPKNGLSNFYVARLPDFPDALLCSVNCSISGSGDSEVVYAGIVLLKKPEAVKPNLKKRAAVRLSFCNDISSFEKIEADIHPVGGVFLQYKEENDDWMPLPLQSNLFQITDSGIPRTRTFINFIPSLLKNENQPIPALFHMFSQSNVNSSVLPFLDGNIWWYLSILRNFKRIPKALVECFTDTVEDSMAYQCTIAYIKQLMMQIEIQMAKFGIVRFSYEIMFSANFEQHKRDVFSNLCTRELANIERKRFIRTCEGDVE